MAQHSVCTLDAKRNVPNWDVNRSLTEQHAFIQCIISNKLKVI